MVTVILGSRFRAVVKRLVLLVVVLATACTGSSSEDLSRLLDSGAPAGFRAGPDDANGSLSSSEAAQSAPVPREELKRFFDDHDYEAGYARVWTKGDAFVTTVVYRFGGARHATGLVALVRSSFAAVQGGEATDFRGIPGAVDYQFYVRPAPDQPYQLCRGLVFAVAEYAHLVSGCGSTPPDGPMLELRAKEQHARTTRLAHGSASGTGPKAGTAMSSESVTVHTGSAP
jgi:hypothetical protein